MRNYDVSSDQRDINTDCIQGKINEQSYDKTILTEVYAILTDIYEL